jgi:hypothetical protein
MIVRSTAISGGSLIAAGILLLANEPSFIYQADGIYGAYVGLTLVLSAAGIWFQERMKYHLSHEEKNDELKQQIYVHHVIDLNRTADS